MDIFDNKISYGFESDYTCPTINKNIVEIIRNIRSELLAFFESKNIIISFIELEELVNSIYNSSINKYIENIRRTNANLRTEAEDQIEVLSLQLKELEDSNESLTEQLIEYRDAEKEQYILME